MDALRWMSIGYAEARVKQLEKAAKEKKEQPVIELNEIEQAHPHLMMSRGYEALNGRKKPNETVLGFYVASDEDPEIAQAKATLDKLQRREAELTKKLGK